MNIPRVVIAGAHSGVGKTTLTLGLLNALKNRNLKVQPFKVGPDYIDPGLHEAVCNVPSHNLDSWMGNENIVKEVFTTYSFDKDIAVIEGVMGLFDGAKGEKEKGSTAHIAKILKAPVILVVNAKGMARSCAALIKGYIDFDPELNVAGVIFNNVGSPNHAEFLKNIVKEELDIPCIGFLMRKNEIKMPERHLGLTPAAENTEFKSQLDSLVELIEEGIDFEALLKVARSAPQIESVEKKSLNYSTPVPIGVAWDAAFNSYYHDSITYLKELGAEIKFFSPLKDEKIPEVAGLYFGGGFPEMFLKELSSNKSMLSSIKKAHEEKMPIYAECDGFMYLLEKIKDFEENVYEGVGIIPGTAQMTKRLAALGYVKATAISDTLLGEKGTELKGHEFHWSKVEGIPEKNSAYALVGGRGKENRKEGYVKDNLLGSYVQLHLRSNPKAAQNFVNACRNFSRKVGLVK